MAELYKSAKDVRIERAMILNSKVLTVGDFYIQSPAGVDVTDATTERVTGIVVGITTPDGRPLDQAVSGTDYNGTWVSSTRTYTAAADNQTVDKIMVNVRPVITGDVYSAELDATINTTTGSGLPGYYISVLTSDATKLDESTASSSIQQFQLVDAGDGTASNPGRGGNHVLIKVAETQIPQAAQG